MNKREATRRLLADIQATCYKENIEAAATRATWGCRPVPTEDDPPPTFREKKDESMLRIVVWNLWSRGFPQKEIASITQRSYGRINSLVREMQRKHEINEQRKSTFPFGQGYQQ